MSAPTHYLWLCGHAWWASLLALGVAGCAVNPPILHPFGGTVQVVGGAAFPISVVRWVGPAALDSDLKEVVVVLEGDGQAFTPHGRPSPNPTPRNAVGLELAAAASATHPTLYSARPGQWGTAAAFTPADWTARRFSTALVNAQVQVIAAEMDTFSAPPVLVGYSGGAAIARAVAQAYPSQVAGLISVAGNVLPDATNAKHGFAPFANLHPALGAPMRFPAGVPVLLVQGRGDKIIPTLTPSEIPPGPCVALLTLDATHAKLKNGQPWASAWPKIWAAFEQVRQRCYAAKVPVLIP
jgi:pimeloyl-ACP methyl ester carboxylesterase